MVSAGNIQHISIKTKSINADIPLTKGWNGFSMLIGEQESSGDRNVSLSTGRNLIGYSSPKSIKVNKITFTNATSTYSYQQALTNGLLLSLNKTSGNNSLGQSVVLRDDYLYMNSAYWFVVGSPCNVTFTNVGGSAKNATYLRNNLMFRNASGAELNLTSAQSVGWINNTIWYTNPGTESYSQVDCKPPTFVCSLSPWKGYFILSNQENITLLRQNYIPGLNEGKNQVHIKTQVNEGIKKVKIQIKK
jgi:hypothetical protein